MKNGNWFTFAECLMLVGSGVGSVATVASQQVVFAAAPISALLLLNLLNHRRIEKAAQETTAIAISQLDQKFSISISTLQQQVQALPSALNLANLRKDLQSKNQENYNQLLQSIKLLQQEGLKPEWRILPQEVDQLKGHYYALENSLAGVRESFSRINPSLQLAGVEGEMAELREVLAQLQTQLQGLGNEQKLNHYRVLQDQINHINRRLNKLPAPFDASALKQDVDALIKHVGDMVTRRDLSRFEAQIERVTYQGNVIEQSLMPLRVVSNILKKQVDTVVAKVNVLETNTTPRAIAPSPSSHAETETLKETVSTLEQRLNQLPNYSELRALRTDMEAVVSSHLSQLQQQLDTVERQTQELEHQQQNLRDWVHRLPQLLDASALQNEVKYLATRVEWAESTMAELQTQAESTRNSPQYEWVMDMQRLGQGSLSWEDNGPAAFPLQISRYLLEQAFDEAQARLIVVFPFPTPEILNQAMLQRFRQFLDQNGCLDIGWGHLGNGNLDPATANGTSPWEARSLLSIERQRATALNEQSFLFTLLNQLTELKKQYPDRFRFKVLGTNESFLVGDRAFALLGSSTIPTTSIAFPSATLGIRTTDPNVIQRLVERFDHPEAAGQDIAMYFNRAATRYDLGDRQGAISDYSEVLMLDPTDDVAYNNRGLARYDLGDKEGAIADFTAAVQQNPGNVTAYCNQGYVRSELGDKAGAIADYNRALQLNPRCIPAYFHRGLARTRLQNKQGAIADYTEVIRLTPDHASAHFYRGLAHAKLNQRSEAIQDLRRAAQLFAAQGDDANYQQTANAIRKLQKTMISAGGSPILANPSREV